MNKQELIAKIAKDTGSSKAGAAAAVARKARRDRDCGDFGACIVPV